MLEAVEAVDTERAGEQISESSVGSSRDPPLDPSAEPPAETLAERTTEVADEPTDALRYWRLRLELSSTDARLVNVLRLLATMCAPRPPTVIAVHVSGAGAEGADGEYCLDGEYHGAPLYKKGQLWMLRYRLPSGNHCAATLARILEGPAHGIYGLALQCQRAR